MKPYDAAMRTIMGSLAGDLIELFMGLRCKSVVALDTDVSTFTSQVDGVYDVVFADHARRNPNRLVDPESAFDDGEVVHIEIQAGHCMGLIRREFFHNVDVMRKHNKPARTMIVFLSPEAFRQSYTGHYQIVDSRGQAHDFHYDVVKAWTIDQMVLLSRPGTMPLAVLTAKSADELPGLFEAMDQALASQPEAVRHLVYTGAYLLGGAMWPVEMLNELIAKDPAMKESVTYQAILAEGEAKGIAKGIAEGEAKGIAKARAEDLLRFGAGKFKAPTAAQRLAIMRATPERLEHMMDVYDQVASWDELLEAY